MAVKKPSKRAVELQQRIENVVRVKAYEISQRDNCNDPLRNWLQAEKELSAK